MKVRLDVTLWNVWEPSFLIITADVPFLAGMSPSIPRQPVP